MKNKSGLGFMVAGLILLAASFVLTGYNLWDQYRAGETASSVLEELNTVFPYDEDHKESILSKPEELKIPDYILNPDMEMPVIEIDGQEYIGMLSIPAINIELPVMSEWSYPKLKIAPCRYSGSAYQGNLIIAAHNYSTHFGNLKNLSVGDEVIFADASGNLFYFQVAELEILQSTDIEGMQSGDWSLTLFTCTIDGQSRVTVRCDVVEHH